LTRCVRKSTDSSGPAIRRSPRNSRVPAQPPSNPPTARRNARDTGERRQGSDAEIGSVIVQSRTTRRHSGSGPLYRPSARSGPVRRRPRRRPDPHDYVGRYSFCASRCSPGCTPPWHCPLLHGCSRTISLPFATHVPKLQADAMPTACVWYARCCHFFCAS
jgi:hypothetical protein